jgi:hypothetical protein
MVQCVKNCLMSDFRLAQIAPFLEKDERTLRRWCELGHVPGAYRRPGGRGHWRIRGESVQIVVAAITAAVGAAPIKTRRRRENIYPPDVGRDFFGFTPRVTPRQAWRATDQDEAMALRRTRGLTVERGHRDAGLWLRRCVHLPGRGVFDFRKQTDRRRYLLEIVNQLVRDESRETVATRAQQKDAKELRGVDLEWIARNTHDGDYEGMIKAGVESARLRNHSQDDGWNQPDNPYANPDTFPRISATMLAAKLRTSRSTFYRWFPNWKMIALAAAQGSALMVRVGRDERAGLRGDPIFEQVELPEHCTDRERRLFTSAALYG